MNEKLITIACLYSVLLLFSRPEPGPDGQDRYVSGKLNLVDLAGSERQSKQQEHQEIGSKRLPRSICHYRHSETVYLHLLMGVVLIFRTAIQTYPTTSRLSGWKGKDTDDCYSKPCQFDNFVEETFEYVAIRKQAKISKISRL
ncbi:hypothetical protein BASA61_008654 [Batrachochytrium salamandrivorans]|nr:hypothetical protein BASA61_008654 [Batrachochytrium salamandrivorans]